MADLTTLKQVTDIATYLSSVLGPKNPRYVASNEQINILYMEFKNYKVGLIDMVMHKLYKEDVKRYGFPEPSEWLKHKRTLLYLKGQQEQTKKALKYDPDEELASPEEVKRIMRKIQAKFAAKSKAIKNVTANEVESAKDRRQRYKKDGFVCCNDPDHFDLCGPILREEAVRKKLKFTEY